MRIWETHMDGIEIPEDFKDTSYGNDACPSIADESGRFYIWVQDEETWNDIGWDIKDFKKYSVVWHKTEQVYGEFPEGRVEKNLELWADVLIEIEEWRKVSAHNCEENVIHEVHDEGLGDAYYCAICYKLLQVG